MASKSIKTYFIASRWPGPVKIGRSNNPKRRLKSLQTAFPETLYILATMDGDLEMAMKTKFKGSHLRGEWFEPSEDLMDWIESLSDFKTPEEQTL